MDGHLYYFLCSSLRPLCFLPKCSTAILTSWYCFLYIFGIDQWQSERSSSRPVVSGLRRRYCAPLLTPRIKSLIRSTDGIEIRYSTPKFIYREMRRYFSPSVIWTVHRTGKINCISVESSK